MIEFEFIEQRFDTLPGLLEGRPSFFVVIHVDGAFSGTLRLTADQRHQLRMVLDFYDEQVEVVRPHPGLALHWFETTSIDWSRDPRTGGWVDTVTGEPIPDERVQAHKARVEALMHKPTPDHLTPLPDPLIIEMQDWCATHHASVPLLTERVQDWIDELERRRWQPLTKSDWPAFARWYLDNAKFEPEPEPDLTSERDPTSEAEVKAAIERWTRFFQTFGKSDSLHGRTPKPEPEAEVEVETLYVGDLVKVALDRWTDLVRRVLPESLHALHSFVHPEEEETDG